MGAFEAIAMIGISYVLISLYRVLSHAERRYQRLWRGPKKEKRSRGGKTRATRVKRAKPSGISARKRRGYPSGYRR